MATDVVIAKMGPEMESALLTDWLVADGDVVVEGAPIATIETDKITTDLEAPASGRIRIFAAVETECAVGERLASILAEGEEPAGDADGPAPAAPTEGEDPGGPAPVPSAAPLATSSPGDGARSSLRASPVARRLAADRGVDLEVLAAANPGRPLRKRDVLAALAAPASAPALAAAPSSPRVAPPAEREPFSPMRRRISQRLVASLQETAQITDFREHDVTDLVALRREGSRWAKRLGTGLSFTDLFVRATVLALAEVPDLNASLEGDELVRHGEVNVGIAVAIPAGLIVPVLHGAQDLSLGEIHTGVAALVERARTGSLSLEELAGGTFTLTNIGSYGSQMATPILIGGQVGILGTGAFLERPVVRNGEITVGTTMYTSLTIDHRVVDGKAAGDFQTAIGALLAEPERLL
ncbi:MAG: 2-oxo acid dehydrogenase subunit E2 [Actinobacteria bacterium]|nr:2-oxo acid dehydrogenase subunit E2 [Actinomycetota bacterium]